MNIEKMGGSIVYAKYLALAKKNYTLTPVKNKYKTTLDYYKPDGAANWGNSLYHYCSIDTLKIITQNKQLRFSDVQFLKDTTELKNAIWQLRHIIKEQENSIDKELYNILNDEDIFIKLENYTQRYPFYPPVNSEESIDSINPTCKVYTCSLSMHGDVPEMWKDYTKNGDGACIKFKELEQYVKTEEKIKIIFGKVWYHEEDKKQCIEALLKDIGDLFSLIPDEECRKDMIQTVLISAMNHMRIFMKNESYSHEEEYRAVLIVPEEIIEKNKLPKGYNKDKFVREEQTVPCIDAPFAPESISCVIVGNGINEEITLMKNDLKDWMEQQGMNDIKIYESNVPVEEILKM